MRIYQLTISTLQCWGPGTRGEYQNETKFHSKTPKKTKNIDPWWGPGRLEAAESNSEQEREFWLGPAPTPQCEARKGGAELTAAKLSLARLHKLFIGFK